MANRAGLKKVIKTVRTKKGVKRQTFWVKANADAPKGTRKPKADGHHPASVAKTALKIGALGAAAYGGYRLLRHLHSVGKDHVQNGHTMNFGKHAGKLVGAAAAATNSGPANQASFLHGGMFGNLKHEATRVAKPVTFGH